MASIIIKLTAAPEDADSSDDSGLTEDAYLRLVTALSGAGFEAEEVRKAI